MSEEVEPHVMRKYEILQKLGRLEISKSKT